MADIKAGTKVFIKTTEEPVMVLSINPGQGSDEYPDLSGTTVVVRRPVASESTGIQHEVATFFLEELETEEDKRRDAFKNLMSFREEVSGSSNTVDMTSGDLN